jgi:hypothetical protein
VLRFITKGMTRNAEPMKIFSGKEDSVVIFIRKLMFTIEE